MTDNKDPDWLSIKEAIERLPSTMEPRNDQWSAIRSRIETEAQGVQKSSVRHTYSYSWMPYAVAASLLLAVVSTVISWKTMTDYRALQQQQLALFEQQRNLQRMEQQRQLLKAQFLEDFSRAADRLDPAVVADVRNNLVVIEQALADIQRALKQDPGNSRLNALLMETYAHERQLIEQVKVSYTTI
jgi:hypothetical protein